MNTTQIAKCQKALNIHLKAGLAEDGVVGPKTVQATKAFQVKLGLTPSGNLDLATVGFLFMDNPQNYIELNVPAKPWVKDYLKTGQYYQEIYPKKQIILHHTVSGANPINVINDWDRTIEAVATAFVIGGKYTASDAKRWAIKNPNSYDGVVYEAFPWYFWAHALGMRNAENLPRNRESIQIELCSYGGLTATNADKTQFKNIYEGVINLGEADKLNAKFRGFEAFHKYSEAQMTSLIDLLRSLTSVLDIPLPKKGSVDYNWFSPNGISKDAVNGKPGVYLHTHFRLDKSDCHPSPLLIDALNNL